MKRLIFSVLLAITSFSTLFAQDIIYKNDGSKISALIKEVNSDQIKYVRYDNQNGPTYIINLSLVKEIQYENGAVEKINSNRQTQSKNSSLSRQPYKFQRNIIYYHLIDVLYLDFTLSYEHILENRKVGIQIPVGIGYNQDANFFNFYNKFYTGFGINYYIPKVDRISYLTGFDLRIGLGEGESETYIPYDPNDPFNTGYWIYSKEETMYSKLLINNAVVFNPYNNITFMAKLGIGIRYVDKELDLINKGFSRTANFSINFGIRF
jgi:hypothetical protein